MENVPLNIIIDTHIPYIKGVLEPYVQSVRYLEPSAIDAAAMADAHCLITRTRTRVDAVLLDGSPCRMVATATIGTDHIDLAYCHSHGITVANAPDAMPRPWHNTCYRPYSPWPIGLWRSIP